MTDRDWLRLMDEAEGADRPAPRCYRPRLEPDWLTDEEARARGLPTRRFASRMPIRWPRAPLACDCKDDRDMSPVCCCDYSNASTWRRARRWFATRHSAMAWPWKLVCAWLTLWERLRGHHD